MNITERVFDKYLRILSFFVYNKNYNFFYYLI